MHKNQRRPFTPQENNFIRESVKLVGENWVIISKILTGRTPKQIHDRYQNYLREGLKKDPWTKEEDNQLISLYEEMGPKWTKMIENLPGRSANDIKNRWHKHLVKKIADIINKNSSEKTNDEVVHDDNNNHIEKINLNNDNLDDLFNSVFIKEEWDFDDFNDGAFFGSYSMI